MARRQTTAPADFLQSLISPRAIRRAAILTGFLQRQRKVDVVEFVLSVVFLLCGRGGQSVAGMRRLFTFRSGVQVARSAFFDRLNEPFHDLVEWILLRLQEQSLRREVSLPGLLGCFKDIVAVDATVVKVHDSLESVWPGTRRRSAPAAVKVHTWVRALTGELLKHKITSERVSDTRSFGVGWSSAGKLLLFDRGFPSASMWWRINRVGAFFLTRLPGSYWPCVVSENRRHRGRARKLIHQDLREAARTLKRTVIDVNCVFRAHVRAYRVPRGRYEWPHFRVVGLWNARDRRYHFYVTNIGPERVPAELLGELYRLRWEAETFYKLGKSGLGLDELRSTKPHVVRTLIRAALIRASVAMRARLEAERTLPGNRWINPVQWLTVWRAFQRSLTVQVPPAAPVSSPSWRQLAALAVDPNRKRPTSRWRWARKPLWNQTVAS